MPCCKEDTTIGYRFTQIQSEQILSYAPPSLVRTKGSTSHIKVMLVRNLSNSFEIGYGASFTKAHDDLAAIGEQNRINVPALTFHVVE